MVRPDLQTGFYKFTRGGTQLPKLNEKYLDLFGEKKNGIFVEVGGFDGTSVSNTLPLADLGWKGYYIEPSPDFCNICRENHKQNPNITVIEKAVGDKAGPVKLYKNEAGSTTRKDYEEIYKQIPWAGNINLKEYFEVQQITLNEFLTKFRIEPEFDLLVVDVEGSESAVFSAFDLTFWKPKVMIVEMVDIHPDLQKIKSVVEEYKALRKHILNSGYKQYHADPINSVFVLKV